VEITALQIEWRESAIFEEKEPTDKLRFAFIAYCRYGLLKDWMITRLIKWHILVDAIDFRPFILKYELHFHNLFQECLKFRKDLNILIKVGVK